VCCYVENDHPTRRVLPIVSGELAITCSTEGLVHGEKIKFKTQPGENLM
jgi:hypothetical protein